MANLDELINSLLGAASSDLESLPLISSSTFPESGDIYVGCYAKWLHEKRYLNGPRVRLKNQFNPNSNPSAFSKEVVNGIIFAKDIDEDAQGFSIEYVRDKNLFLHDFADVNITRKNKNIGDRIPDDSTTYKSIAEIISQRFDLYRRHDPSWAVAISHYSEVELNDFEKTERGWIDAVIQLQLTAPISEKKGLMILTSFGH